MRPVARVMGLVVLLGALRVEAAEPAMAPTEPRGQVFVDGGYPLFLVATRSPRPALGLEYEHAMSRLVSLHLTLRASAAHDPDLGRTYLPVVFAPGVRFYPFAERALTGFWLGPQLSVMQLEFVSDGRVVPSAILIPGLGAGYTFSPVEHLAVSAGLTADWWWYGGTTRGGLVTFVPRVAVGYRF